MHIDQWIVYFLYWSLFLTTNIIELNIQYRIKHEQKLFRKFICHQKNINWFTNNTNYRYLPNNIIQSYFTFFEGVGEFKTVIDE